MKEIQFLNKEVIGKICSSRSETPLVLYCYTEVCVYTYTYTHFSYNLRANNKQLHEKFMGESLTWDRYKQSTYAFMKLKGRRRRRRRRCRWRIGGKGIRNFNQNLLEHTSPPWWRHCFILGRNHRLAGSAIAGSSFNVDSLNTHLTGFTHSLFFNYKCS